MGLRPTTLALLCETCDFRKMQTQLTLQSADSMRARAALAPNRAARTILSSLRGRREQGKCTPPHGNNQRVHRTMAGNARVPSDESQLLASTNLAGQQSLVLLERELRVVGSHHPGLEGLGESRLVAVPALARYK